MQGSCCCKPRPFCTQISCPASPSPCTVFNADLVVTGACYGLFPCRRVAVGVGYCFGDVLSFAKTVFVAVSPAAAGVG